MTGEESDVILQRIREIVNKERVELPKRTDEQYENRNQAAHYYSTLEERPHSIRDMETKCFHKSLCVSIDTLL